MAGSAGGHAACVRKRGRMRPFGHIWRAARRACPDSTAGRGQRRGDGRRREDAPSCHMYANASPVQPHQTRIGSPRRTGGVGPTNLAVHAPMPDARTIQTFRKTASTRPAKEPCATLKTRDCMGARGEGAAVRVGSCQERALPSWPKTRGSRGMPRRASPSRYVSPRTGWHPGRVRVCRASPTAS